MTKKDITDNNTDHQANTKNPSRHLRVSSPSPWVERFAPLIPKPGPVLDMAAGGGRHSRLLLKLGHQVIAVDKSGEPLAVFKDNPNITVIEADLETEASPFSQNGVFSNQKFAGIVVVNYLYRPYMQDLIGALAPGGVLIYETFSRGHEVYSRPRNPDHLLKNGELLELAGDKLQIVGYENGLIQDSELPGVKQRLCAVNDLEDNEHPTPHSLG